jgi:hypothetical protein
MHAYCVPVRILQNYDNFHDFLFLKNWKIPFPITEEDSET